MNDTHFNITKMYTKINLFSCLLNYVSRIAKVLIPNENCGKNAAGPKIYATYYVCSAQMSFPVGSLKLGNGRMEHSGGNGVDFL